MSLPPVSAEITADAVAALAARLRKRLDAVIEQAREWPVTVEGEVVTIRPDDQVVVTLTGPVTEAGDAVCSCLLSPRCLHRTAVLSIAPILDEPDPVTSVPAAPVPAAPVPAAPVPAAPVPAASAASASAASAPALSAPDPSAPGSAAPGSAAPGSAVPISGDSPIRDVDQRPTPAESGGAVGGVVGGVVGGAAGGAASGAVGRAAGERGDTPDGSGRNEAAASVRARQREAAAGLSAVVAELLSAGISGAGAVAQADLLRAVHRARAAGVHAPAVAAVRIVEQLRAARRDDPGFRLASLTADVRELLLACHLVGSGSGAALGVARRDYEPVGDLRLHGIFSEPVRAATGHAGVVTYLADAAGTVWVVSDVRPAEPDAPRPSTHASVDLGEARLSHHDLARGGLLAVNAHASAARRLSHGRARQAVAVAGVGWFAEPLDGLWRTGVGAQVDRWLAGVARPGHERPAAHDLAFLDGTIAGADRRGLLLDVDGLTVVVTAAVVAPASPDVTNLRLLVAHAGGRRVRLAGRFTGSREVAALAVAAPWLDERHGGHVDLGATPLTRADLLETAHPEKRHGDAADVRHGDDTDGGQDEVTGPGQETGAGLGQETAAGPGQETAAGPGQETAAGQGAGPVPPPLHLLRHQLERVVSAGRGALLPGVDHDVRRLSAAHLGGAAAVLTGLGAAGVRRTRDVFGRLDPHDAQVLAGAWLAAAAYEQAAEREVMRTAWTTT
jgi:hypothetical protein